MGKIFCLIGKSNTGKDTILDLLLNDKDLDLKPIVSYTTRPIRRNEKDGVTYHYIDEATLTKLDNANKIIEYRKYETDKGIWYYATVDDNQINLKTSNYICIVDLDGYTSYQNYFGEEKVIPIYIEVEDGIRLERALNRERSQLNPNYTEMCRRFIVDAKDFNYKRLEECKIDIIYKNIILDSCFRLIKHRIKNNSF